MKTIFNIYEGILDDIDTSIKKGDEAVEKIESSFKERFIKIITESGHLSDTESTRFREIFDDILNVYNHTYFITYFPTQLQTALITCSDKKLKKKIFAGFSSAKREYDFACSMKMLTFMNMDNSIANIEKLVENVAPGKELTLNKGLKVIKLGNSIMAYYKDIMIIWVNGIFRVVVRSTIYPRKYAVTAAY